MKGNLELEFELFRLNGEDPGEDEVQACLEAAAAAIRLRLMGEGFTPEDMFAESLRITGGPVPESRGYVMPTMDGELWDPDIHGVLRSDPEKGEVSDVDFTAHHDRLFGEGTQLTISRQEYALFPDSGTAVTLTVKRKGFGESHKEPEQRVLRGLHALLTESFPST